jgi:hypothetical protein
MKESTPMNQDNAQPALSPTALSVADVAQLLAKLGGYAATPAMIEADLAAGAPANADGTINVLHYCAWLAREVDHAD